MTAPPRAPTFPALDADPVRAIDDIDDDAAAAAPESRSGAGAPALAPARSPEPAFHTPVRLAAPAGGAPLNSSSPNYSAMSSSSPAPAPAHMPPPPSASSSSSSATTTTTSSAAPSAAPSAALYGTPAAGSGRGAASAATGGSYRSRLGAVLTWKDPKVSALALAADLFFFYLTMWKQFSILSVLGAALGLYLTLGLIVVNINKRTGHQLDRFIKRPAQFTPIFRKDSAYRLADTLVDEGNDLAEDARHVLYCDDTQLTMAWIAVAFCIYVIGRSFSLLPVMFLFTICLFTLPIAYEKNKKVVDDTLAHAQTLASKHLETGRRAAGEHACRVYDLAAEKSAPLLAKSPALKNMADKVGFTPSKTRKSR